MYDIKIRFNTNFRQDDPASKEWRVIVNGRENFCNHVRINCPSETSRDFIEGVGEKWHISCQASKVDYIPDPSVKTESNLFREILIA